MLKIMFLVKINFLVNCKMKQKALCFGSCSCARACLSQTRPCAVPELWPTPSARACLTQTRPCAVPELQPSLPTRACLSIGTGVWVDSTGVSMQTRACVFGWISPVACYGQKNSTTGVTPHTGVSFHQHGRVVCHTGVPIMGHGRVIQNRIVIKFGMDVINNLIGLNNKLHI